MGGNGPIILVQPSHAWNRLFNNGVTIDGNTVLIPEHFSHEPKRLVAELKSNNGKTVSPVQPFQVSWKLPPDEVSITGKDVSPVQISHAPRNDVTLLVLSNGNSVGEPVPILEHPFHVAIIVVTCVVSIDGKDVRLEQSLHVLTSVNGVVVFVVIDGKEVSPVQPFQVELKLVTNGTLINGNDVSPEQFCQVEVSCCALDKSPPGQLTKLLQSNHVKLRAVLAVMPV